MLFVLGLTGVHAILFPASSFFDPPPSDLSTAQFVLSIGTFVLCFALAKFMFFRIRVIRYDNEKVEVINGGRSRTVKWEDVRGVSKVISVVPPLYRMTFKDGSEPAYFVMSMFFYAYAIIWSWDFTGFYKFARDRIEQSKSG